MPRTPGETDEDLAIPMVVESRGMTDAPSGPGAEGAGPKDRARAPGDSSPTSPTLREASRISHADDLALLSAEIAARSDPGRWVLHAARAFLRDPLGRDPASVEDWREAFLLAPHAWMPFWGLRRGLARASKWEDWLAALDAAVTARPPDPARPDGEVEVGAVPEAAASELRAAQWLEQGQLLEQRLGRPDEAANSYRAGLRETPRHGGLLLALFWTACALPDGWMRAEALEGMLRRRLPWAKRAALTVVAVRSRRGGAAAAPGVTDAQPRSEDHPSGSHAPGDPATELSGRTDSGGVRDRPGARRALLMRTLALAGSPDVRPLLEELAREACATEELLVRAIAMTDLAGRLAPADDPLAAAVLRHASSLYRRHAHHLLLHPSDRAGADDAAIAEATMRAAWRRNPLSPLIAAELAALHGAADAGADGQVRRADRLAVLLDQPGALADGGAMVGGGPAATEAELEVAVAWLGACLAADARAGASPSATPAAPLALAAPLAYLDRHRQLGRSRVDELALVVAVRARAGDRAGLARAFGQVAELLEASGRAAIRPRAPEARIAREGRTGALRPEPAAAPGPPPSPPAFPRASDTGAHPPTLTARRERARDATAAAHAWVVAATLWETVDGTEPAGEAERCWRRALAASPDWEAVAWDRLDRLMRREQRWSELAELLANRLDAMGDSTAGEALVVRAGWLEELVRIHRDRLDDPESAARHHEHLATRATDPVRHLVRRWDLELALVEKGRPSARATRIELLGALGAAAPSPGLAAALWCDAGELALGGGPDFFPLAARAFHRGLAGDRHGRAGSGLEHLALEPEERAAAIEEELAHGFAAGATDPLADVRRRALAFRLAFHHQRGGHPDRARLALGRIVGATGAKPGSRPGELDQGAGALAPDALGPVVRALDAQLARGRREPAIARGGRPEPTTTTPPPPGGWTGSDGAPLEVPSDRAEALERAGALEAAEAAFRQLVREDDSVEAALGWLRVAAALRDPALTRQATSVLAGRLGAPERRWMQREERLLAILHEPDEPRDERPDPQAPDDPKLGPAEGEAAPRPARTAAPIDAVLGWAEGIRSRDPSRAASGLVMLATVADAGAGAGASADRDGLLLRAALRARLGADAVSSAVHAQIPGLSPTLVLVPAPSLPLGSGVGVFPPGALAGHDPAASLAEAFTCSLADLPVAGRAERIAARHRRADRSGGALAYALELECAYDAEARGDAGAGLDGFARALARDHEGIEALDGLRRIAAARGDARGAVAAGLRLAAVLRDPLHAAAELERAGRLLEELGRVPDAIVAYWQAFARNPRSALAYARLEALLAEAGTAPPEAATGDGGGVVVVGVADQDGEGDGDRDRRGPGGDQHAPAADGLERLYSVRLSVEQAPDARVRVLLARAQHRARPGGDRRGAIQDLQRVLALEPTQVTALAQLLELARCAGAVTHAMAYAQALLGCVHEPRARVELCLTLAALQVAAGQRDQAEATLRACARAAPHARAVWERLTALALEDGHRREALAALQGWVEAVDDPGEQARLWMHIGAVQRALARADGAATDPPDATRRGAITSAVAAFRLAVALGIGTPGHVALAGALAEAGAWAERAHWLAGTIGIAVGRVRDDPTDVAGVEELHVLFELARQPAGAPPGTRTGGPEAEGEGALIHPPAPERDARRAESGARITAQLLARVGAPRTGGRHRVTAEVQPRWSGLALAGSEVAVGEATPESRADHAPGNAGAGVDADVGAGAGAGALPAVRFIGELVPSLASQPGPTRVAASVWAELAPSAEALLGPRATPPELGARAAVSTALHPEIAWIEHVAVALGLPTLRVSVVHGGGGGTAVALDGPRPELVLPADIFARAHEPEVRFRVARVLGLLREHAVCFDAVEDAEVDLLLRSAVALASGWVMGPARPSLSTTEPVEEGLARAVKILGRALPRKARKALIGIVTGDPSRAEAQEVAGELGGFRARVVELADRVGLAVGGDLGAAIGALAPAEGDVSPVLGARARALVRFALTDAFLLADRETEDVASPTSLGPAMEF